MNDFIIVERHAIFVACGKCTESIDVRSCSCLTGRRELFLEPISSVKEILADDGNARMYLPT